MASRLVDLSIQFAWNGDVLLLEQHIGMLLKRQTGVRFKVQRERGLLHGEIGLTLG
jgi:hypothetical protein